MCFKFQDPQSLFKSLKTLKTSINEVFWPTDLALSGYSFLFYTIQTLEKHVWIKCQPGINNHFMFKVPFLPILNLIPASYLDYIYIKMQ